MYKTADGYSCNRAEWGIPYDFAPKPSECPEHSCKISGKACQVFTKCSAPLILKKSPGPLVRHWEQTIYVMWSKFKQNL